MTYITVKINVPIVPDFKTPKNFTLYSKTKKILQKNWWVRQFCPPHDDDVFRL